MVDVGLIFNTCNKLEIHINREIYKLIDSFKTYTDREISQIIDRSVYYKFWLFTSLFCLDNTEIL